MTLINLLNVLGSGEWVRIATEEGEQWIIADRVIHVDEKEVYSWLKDRQVLNIYTVDKRDANPHCCKIEAGIAIIVTGNENGRI
jgi:hypothetical protein